MLSDSPYDLGTPVLTPRAGLAAGLAAATLMLAFVAGLQPLSGLALADLLTRIGGIVVSPARAGESSAALAGVVIHACFGALFSVLYAACQRRIPSRGLIAVGLFYGLVLWIIGGVVVGWLFGETLRATVRAWPWLLACLLFGLFLAGAGIWTASRRPAAAAVPLD